MLQKMNDVINIYIAVGLIGVLVILLIAQCIKDDKYGYSDSDYLMIKMGSGIIKTNTESLADKVFKIITALNKKQYENIEYLIIPATKHLDEFIKINPVSGNAELFELKARIIYETEIGDLSSGVMSDVNSAILPYDNFIKKLKIVHKMLINKLCNGGLLDYRSIAYIVEQCCKITPIYYENDTGNVVLPKSNNTSLPKLSLFEAKQSQPADQNTDQTIERRPTVLKVHKQPKKAQNIDRNQERS